MVPTLRAAAGAAAGRADVARARRLHLAAAGVAEGGVDRPDLGPRLGPLDLDRLGRRSGLLLVRGLRRRVPAPRAVGRVRLLALGDALDAERLTLLRRQVLQGQAAEDVVHQRGREPDVGIVRDARRL